MNKNIFRNLIWGYIGSNILLLLVAFLGRSNFNLVAWVSIVQLVLTLGVMIWGMREFVLVGVIFLALTYLFHFGQSLIIALGFNDLYADRNVLAKTSFDSYITAELFAMTSMFFVGLGYLIVNRFSINRNCSPKENSLEDNLTSEAIYEIRKVSLIIFSVSVFPMVFIDTGKILAAILGDYMDTYKVYATGLGKIMYAISQFCRPSIIVLLFTYANDKKKANAILIASTLYYLFMMLSGDRGTGMIYLIANFLVYFRFVLQLKVFHVIAGVVACYLLMCFLSVISAFRYRDFSIESFLAVLSLRETDGIIYSFLREFGGTMISLVYAIDYIPSYSPHAYGLTYLTGLITVLPSVPDSWAEALMPIWSFVRSFPVEVQNSLGGSFLGELYFNFGWFGSAAAVLVGMLLGSVDREFLLKKSPFVIAVALVALPTLFLWTRDFYCTMLLHAFWFAAAFFVFNKLSKKRKFDVVTKLQKKCTTTKRILIITSDKFPKGNAGATRQEALAKLMVQCNYTVDIIGLGQSTGFEWQQLIPQINYISLRSNKQTPWIRLLDRLLFTIRIIQACEKRDVYDAILIESVPFGVIQYVKRYGKEFDCTILHDSVEWYSASEFKLGVFSPTYILKDLNNRFLINKQFGVIAISSYLKNYYSGKGIRCEYIPFIHDVEAICPKKRTVSDKVVFLYAGMMGKKDQLGGFLRAVARLEPSDRQRIEIRLFGFQRNYLIQTGNADEALLETLCDQIKLYGRVPRHIVEENLQEADFALLFRNAEERYAKAGFPTKVVESLSCSTPMFCNLSSDLGEYLRDGENSILCLSESEEDIYTALCRALLLSTSKKATMQENARNCALKNFDYRGYDAELSRLLEGQ